MEISVRASSAYYQTLLEVQKQVPGLRINTVPETMLTESIIDGVARGEYEATVCDDNLWYAVASAYDELAAPFALSENREVVLLMRPGDKELKNRVDEILLARQISPTRERIYTDDLDGLKKRGRLRMITRNNALTYFIHRGMQVGYEYELLREFARRNDLRLEIVIPDDHAKLLDYLNEGKGDVVAAAMTINDERAAAAAFTTPYNDVDEVVVVRSDEEGISGFGDLAGRTVHVRGKFIVSRTAPRRRRFRGRPADRRVAGRRRDGGNHVRCRGRHLRRDPGGLEPAGSGTGVRTRPEGRVQHRARVAGMGRAQG